MSSRPPTLFVLVATIWVGCGAPAVTPDGVPEAPTRARAEQEPRPLERRPVEPRVFQLPPSARQLDEGYWLGAMIGPGDVAGLRQMGIRAVMSAVRPDDKTLLALKMADLEWVDVPMGNTFDHGEQILEVAGRYPPQAIFIHCRHGADRTGAIAAFLLVTRHGWSLADAFYSVLYPSERDARGLARVLDEYGIVDSRSPEDPRVGFYSVTPTGTTGGLKARNRRYRRLVESTFEAIIEQQVSWQTAE